MYLSPMFTFWVQGPLDILNMSDLPGKWNFQQRLSPNRSWSPLYSWYGRFTGPERRRHSYRYRGGTLRLTRLDDTSRTWSRV